jgi:GntR family transcriptional regulator
MHSSLFISASDGRPMYLQIVDQIKQRVSVGEWPPGQEIPSIRQLAIDLTVSVITVKRAYLELEREGVIVTQHGKGSFIAPQAALHARFYDKELEDRLVEVARLGASLGLTAEELAERLQETTERLTTERLEKAHSR